ncbi:MAG: type II toxin-antitoxin system VapC family toxin [Acidimicrobiia bacterium]|nr:MAG: type II toxin-antitoxin system VapC family toxin [Acidimicrobiia bacterium]
MPGSRSRIATSGIVADYLVDTDVLVDHLRGTAELRARANDRLSYSVVTRAELFAGRADAESEVRRLLDGLTELPVTGLIAENAGRIRRATGVRLPDALIAATAIKHGLRLMTRNRKDYERIPKLRLSGS